MIIDKKTEDNGKITFNSAKKSIRLDETGLEFKTSNKLWHRGHWSGSTEEYHCVGSVVSCFRDYFASQRNCDLVIAVDQQQCQKMSSSQAQFSANILDPAAQNQVVAQLHICINIRDDNGKQICEVDFQNSELADMLVSYQWRLVKILHVGSIDVDGTLIHNNTDATDDTPEKLLAKNQSVQQWAKKLGIAEIVSGSNRQGVHRENNNRQSRKDKGLYSGSSIRLLVKLAELINANFDGVLMADAANGYASGTHAHYLYEEKELGEDGFAKVPDNYTNSIGDEKKIMLLAYLTQYFSNKYCDNPQLQIMLHFLDDLQHIILKPLNEFYQVVNTILPLRVSLCLWERNPYVESPESIKQYSRIIYGAGIRDPHYMRSILFMPNFSPETYDDYFYLAIPKEARVEGTLGHRVLLDVVKKSMKMHSFSTAYPELNYSPSNALFFSSPNAFLTRQFVFWRMRLYIQHSLLQCGYQLDEIDLNPLRDLENWKIIHRQFLLKSDVLKEVEKLRVVIAEAFNLEKSAVPVRAMLDPNSSTTLARIFVKFIVVIDLQALDEQLLNKELLAKVEKRGAPDEALDSSDVNDGMFTIDY